MAKFHNQSNICLEAVRQNCAHTRIKASKVIRAANPDIHVLFYVRDPRGIMNSRKEILQNANFRPMKSSLGKGNYTIEAKYLCKIMHHDFAWWNILKERYPGSIPMLRYEDLARNPLEEAQEVYKFINRTFPKPVKHWLNSTMQSSAKGRKDAKKPFSTSRVNSTATAFKWKTGWSAHEIADLTEACQAVIEDYNYSLD